MKYSLSDCYALYDFFNKDFFKDELGQRLGKCKITTNPKEAEKYMDDYAYNFSEVGGMSRTMNGKHYIYINRYVLDNKRLLMNIILHEMIHLYDNTVSDVRSYNGGHGRLWTRVANYATELYGDDVGIIQQYVNEENWHRIEHNKMMQNSKTLKNTYLVKLNDQSLIPIKNLTNKEISELKDTDIIAIYKVKPDIKQNERTRVKKYATFDSLLDDIAYGITYEEEVEYSRLKLNLQNDCDLIWLKKKYH